MLAFYLMVTSTKGVSARRLSQWLGIQYRSAWHLGHRIRALMAENPEFARKLEGVVEADETYVGGPPRRVNRGPRRPRGQLSTRGNGKPCVLVAVQRSGEARMDLIATHSRAEIGKRLHRWVSPDALLATDELPAYRSPGKRVRAHRCVHHGHGEYARTDRATGLRVHTNTAESVNAVLKGALRSVFHGVSRKHLVRYVAEIQFRWNRRGLSGRIQGLLRGRARPLPFAEVTG